MLLQLDICEEWIALNDILGLWEHFALISERHAFPTVLLWAQAHLPSAQWGFPDRAEGWGLQWEPCVFPCFLCVINLPAFQFSPLLLHLEHTPIGQCHYYLWHKCFSDHVDQPKTSGCKISHVHTHSGWLIFTINAKGLFTSSCDFYCSAV